MLAVSSFAALKSRDAWSAQLLVDAPVACADPASLADEVGNLIGRPLAEVADFDFKIRIARTPRGRWLLRLETVGQRGGADGSPATRGSREIDGATCAELAEAAAVAIAVSVRSMDAAAVAPVPAPAPPGPPLPASPSTPPAIAAISRAAVPWRPAVTVALATDSGTLPGTGPGLELEGNLQHGSLRLTLLGAWFESRDMVGAAGAGTFELALGGALGCVAPRVGRWTPLACGGLELGRLAGTGLDVARPETGAAFWRAVRADVGGTVALRGKTALVLRAGVVVPLARPDFVLDGSEVVYRPSRIAARGTAGVELGF